MPIITTKLCHPLHHYVKNGSRFTEYVLIKQLKRRFIMKLVPNPLEQENNTGISLTLTKQSHKYLALFSEIGRCSLQEITLTYRVKLFQKLLFTSSVLKRNKLDQKIRAWSSLSAFKKILLLFIGLSGNSAFCVMIQSECS